MKIFSLKNGVGSDRGPCKPFRSVALLTNGGALTVVGFIRRGWAGKKSGGDCRSRNSALSSLGVGKR